MHAAPALLETQLRFLAALYDDAEAGPLASIAGNGLDPAARLRVYRHACNEIHAGALRTTYPAVLALVGEAFFAQAARGYRAAYPSRAGNLQCFGRHFAGYLASLPAVHAVPYVPDVARLEWLRQESALAADRHESSVARGVALHPAVRLLESRFPVLTIWRYAVRPTTDRLDPGDAGERVVLWREDDQVAMAALDPASFACVAALREHGAPDVACTAGRAQDPGFDFSACIASLAGHGLLAARAMPDSREEARPCRSPRS